MPRYQFSSNQFASSLLSPNLRNVAGSKSNNGSCRLLAADEHFVHSIVMEDDRFVIETHRLPLERSGDHDYDNYDVDIPKHIRTVLPSTVQEALEIDPPVELLSVEGEKWFTTNMNSSTQLRFLPRLLLYSRKTAFLLKISYTEEEEDLEFVTAQVDACEEPFDQFLQGNMETSILRIRKAPQCSAGFATISPATCFAALIENYDTCEYTILLHHACGTVTSPLRFGVEDTVDEERFTDFCFGQSVEALSIFSSLSILLLKGSGDVFTAAPLVFDGTVIAKSCVDEGHDYLQSQLDSLSDHNSSGWRRMKAALQFFIDVFYPADSRSGFCTAKILRQADRSAAIWPLKLQGPLLFHSGMDPGPLSVAIECFGSNKYFVGFAIGKISGKIDFACLSVTCLIPRFEFENLNDCLEIEDSLCGLASFVERVDICPNSTEVTKEISSVSIISDPIMTTLLHYSTPSVVYTISTNVMLNVSRQINEQPSVPVRTSAWTCLNSSDDILGIVLPLDAVLGHNLVVGFKSKPLTTIDIPSSNYLHDFDNFFLNSRPSESLLLKNEDSLRGAMPFSNEVKPMIDKIKGGLANMSRFVGSETDFKSITPDALAVALRTKKRCDDEVVLPLVELRNMVEKHRTVIFSMLADQVLQLQAIKENVYRLRTRMAAIGELLETAKSNAISLSQRSLDALQASQRLLPTITQAEYDFIQMVKRMNLKSIQLEKYVKQLTESVIIRCDRLNESTVSDSIRNMNPNGINQANTLLAYENKMLTKVRTRLDRANNIVLKLSKESGVSNQFAMSDQT